MRLLLYLLANAMRIRQSAALQSKFAVPNLSTQAKFLLPPMTFSEKVYLSWQCRKPLYKRLGVAASLCLVLGSLPHSMGLVSAVPSFLSASNTQPSPVPPTVTANAAASPTQQRLAVFDNARRLASGEKSGRRCELLWTGVQKLAPGDEAYASANAVSDIVEGRGCEPKLVESDRRLSALNQDVQQAQRAQAPQSVLALAAAWQDFAKGDVGFDASRDLTPPKRAVLSQAQSGYTAKADSDKRIADFKKILDYP